MAWMKRYFSYHLIRVEEDIEFIRYKLRMFGITMNDGHATNIFCDNEAVVKNNTNVESSLSKKHSVKW